MTIQVELSPETRARLAAEAQAFGIAPENYAGRLLEQILAPRPCGSGRLTFVELRTMLREMSEGSENLPHPDGSAFSRESFYEDCA